jgi:putative CocE/NonD family hydrolase
MKKVWNTQMLLAFLVMTFCAVQASEVAPEKSKSQNAGPLPTYTRHEYQIPMRDGVKLFTAVFTPSDASHRYPILMVRTPYNAGLRAGISHNSSPMAAAGYIFVLQDVRGCFQSEGQFVNMRPHIAKKSSKKDIDESTDTYDTIEWLLANIPNHNGRVGQTGVSYPGFYSLAGMIDAHPALKAVSPQGSNSDWWYDDIHHHGAFFLPHAFNFFAYFGVPRAGPTTQSAAFFQYGTVDGYQFYFDLGPIKNANERHLKRKIPFWNEICEHPNYDRFWQERSIVPHLKRVAPAVMTVGGWFDAEALYGPLKTYASIEKHNPGVRNFIVMGPWYHGGWSVPGVTESVGDIHFGSAVGDFKRDIEMPFFEYFLKDKGKLDLPKAYMFETGANQWRKFDRWPPANLQKKSLYFARDGRLSFSVPETIDDAYDS